MASGVRFGRLTGLSRVGLVILLSNCNWFTFAQTLGEGGQSRTSLDRFGDVTQRSSKKSKIQADLGENSYLADGQIESQRREYSQLGLDIDLKTEGSGLSAGAHGIYQGAMQTMDEQYIGLPEAYFGESKAEQTGVRWTVGRQKRHWSRLDEEFGMGIWQPQLRWDYLDPIQQGLTGLFFDYTISHSLDATFFASSIFLPDQGPNFKLQDGQFQSANRWFWAPRIAVAIASQPQPVSFDLANPKIEDVIFQPSLGGSVHYQRSGRPFWAQAAYAYKPMNQMHLGFECDACVPITTLSPRATIHPSVLMHRVATLETGLQDENQNGWLSVTSDVPTTPKGSQAWAQSDHSDVVFAGASYAHIFSLFQHPGWLKASYLRAFEKKETNPQSFVDERVESSLDRYPYQEIVAVEWNWFVMQRARNQMTWRTRYTYSIPERGAWVSSQLWLQHQKWGWNIGLDILGSDIDPSSPDAGLFTRYRENDRVTGGMSYVF